MKYQFKQAALLGRGLAGKGSIGKIYPLGVHEVMEEHTKDRTFVHFAKHGLIVPFKGKPEQGTLKAASSDIAKVSTAAAKSQLEPDAEIGGDSEPDFDSVKGKKRKG